MEHVTVVELAQELESRFLESNGIESLSLRQVTALLNELEAEFLRRHPDEEQG